MTTPRNSVTELYLKLAKVYCEYIKNHFKDRLWSVCLFGSVARGTFDKGSDIDILVVVENLPLDIGLRLKETTHIYLQIKNTEEYKKLKQEGRYAAISTLPFTPQEIEHHPPILLDLVYDSIILYDKNDFLKNVLKRLMKRLEELGSKRVFTARGTYFWILKPDLKPGEVLQI